MDTLGPRDTFGTQCPSPGHFVSQGHGSCLVLSCLILGAGSAMKVKADSLPLDRLFTILSG